MTIRFLATVNTPGYLPMDDDPPVFDEARDAWDYLLSERRDAEDYALEIQGDGYTATFNILEQLSQGHDVIGLAGGVVDTSSDLTGSVYGDTPGYDGDHDLGLVYSVTAVDVTDDEEA